MQAIIVVHKAMDLFNESQVYSVFILWKCGRKRMKKKSELRDLCNYTAMVIITVLDFRKSYMSVIPCL